ncbi:MAG: hypothetical protein D6681_16365 [Calditrichaeota bacterium]|nr:MAG: hypothetical protein D6681_16365 [Calditrichota bacterium]
MNGLEKEYKGALKCEVRNAFSPQSKKEIADLGFQTHGLAIYDPQGHLKVKLDGHRLSEETIRDAVQSVM